MFFIFVFIWLRASLPRLRYDQFMHFGWTRLMPLSLLWILAVASIRTIDLRGGIDKQWLLVAIAVCVVVIGVLTFAYNKKRSDIAEKQEEVTEFDAFAADILYRRCPHEKPPKNVIRGSGRRLGAVRCLSRPRPRGGGGGGGGGLRDRSGRGTIASPGEGRSPVDPSCKRRSPSPTATGSPPSRSAASRLALEVRPMSLYGHVSSKEDLLDRMFDQVAGECLLGDDLPPQWRSGLEAIARRTRDQGMAHPWTIEGRVDRIPLGPDTLRVLDEWMRAL